MFSVDPSVAILADRQNAAAEKLAETMRQWNETRAAHGVLLSVMTHPDTPAEVREDAFTLTRHLFGAAA